MGAPFPFFKKNSVFATGSLKVDALFATDNSPAMSAFQGWLADNTVVTSLNNALISENIGKVDTEAFNVALSNRFAYTRMDESQKLENQYYIEVIFDSPINPLLGTITPETDIIFNYNNNQLGGYGPPSNGNSYKVHGIRKELDYQITNAVYNGAQGEVTVTTLLDHGYLEGDSVIIRGVFPTSFNNGVAPNSNDAFVITAVTSNTFTYSVAGDPGTYANNGQVYKLSNSVILNEYLKGRALATYTNASNTINVSSVEGTISINQRVISPDFPVDTTVQLYNQLTGQITVNRTSTSAQATPVTIEFELEKINSQLVPVGSIVTQADNNSVTELNSFYSGNAGSVSSSRLISNLTNYYVYGDLRLKYFWSTFIDPSILATSSGQGVYNGWFQNTTNDGYNTAFTTGDPDTGTPSTMVITNQQVTSNEDTFNNIVKTLTTQRNNTSKVVDELGYNPRAKAALLYISASNEQGSVNPNRDTSRGSETPGFPVRRAITEVNNANGYWVGIIGGDLNQDNIIEVFEESTSDGVVGDPRGFVPIFGEALTLKAGVMIEDMTYNNGTGKLEVTTYYNHRLTNPQQRDVRYNLVDTFTFTGGTTVLAEQNNNYEIQNLSGSLNGTDAIVKISRDISGAVNTVEILDGGQKFVPTETITIPAASYGDTVDLTITVSTTVNETTRLRIKDSFYTILSGIRTAEVTGDRTFQFDFASDPITAPPPTPQSDYLGYVLGVDMLFTVPKGFYRKSTLEYLYPTGDTRTENAAFQDRKDILCTVNVKEGAGLLQFFNANTFGDFYVNLPGQLPNGVDYKAYNAAIGSSDIKFNVNVKNETGIEEIDVTLEDPGTTTVNVKDSFLITLFINEVSATGFTATAGDSVLIIPTASISDLNPLNIGGGDLGRPSVTTIQTDHTPDGIGIQPRTAISNITINGPNTEVTLSKPITENITATDVINFSFANPLYTILIYVNTKNNFKDLEAEVSFPGYGYAGNGLLSVPDYGDTLTPSDVTNPPVTISSNPAETFFTRETRVADNGITWQGVAADTPTLIVYDLTKNGDAPSTGVNQDLRIFRQSDGNYEVFLTNQGLNFDVGDTITILGTELGGNSPLNDLVITIASVNDESYAVITTTSAHGFVPPIGRSEVKVIVRDNVPSGYNGTYQATVLDDFTLQYNLPDTSSDGTGPGTQVTGGTVRNISLDVINDTFAFLNNRLFYTMDTVQDVQYPFKVDILSATDSAGTITVTTDGAHGLIDGEDYAIGGIRNTTTNTWNTPRTTVTVTGADTFTYQSPGGNIGSYSYGGYVTYWDIVVFGGVYTKNFDRVIFLNIGDTTKEGIPPQRSKDYLVRQINFRQISNDGDVVTDGTKHDFFVVDPDNNDQLILAIADRLDNAGNEIPIVSTTFSNQLVAANTGTVPHRLFPGNLIDINGFANTEYNSPAAGDVVVTTPDEFTFTYERLEIVNGLEPSPVAATFTKSSDVFLGTGGGNPPASRDIIKFSNTNGIPGVDPDIDYYIRGYNIGSGADEYTTFEISPDKIGSPILFTLVIESSSYSSVTGKITIQTELPHYLIDGNIIEISGVLDQAYNGQYPVEIISPVAFNYTPTLPTFVAAATGQAGITEHSPTVDNTSGEFDRVKRGTNAATNSVGSTTITLRGGGGGNNTGLVPGMLLTSEVATQFFAAGTTILTVPKDSNGNDTDQITISQGLIAAMTSGGNNSGNEFRASTNVTGARSIYIGTVGVELAGPDMFAGQVISGTGIPAGTTVLSVTIEADVNGYFLEINNPLTANLVNGATLTVEDNVTGASTIVYTTSTGNITIGSAVSGTGVDIEATITDIDLANNRVQISDPLTQTASGTYTLNPTSSSTSGQVRPTAASIVGGIIQDQDTASNGQVQLTGDTLGWDHPLLAKSTGGALFFQLGFVKQIDGTVNNANSTTLNFIVGEDNSGLTAGDWVFGDGIAPGTTLVSSSNSGVTLDTATTNVVDGLIGFARPGQVSIFPKYTQEFGRILGTTFAEWLFKIA